MGRVEWLKDSLGKLSPAEKKEFIEYTLGVASDVSVKAEEDTQIVPLYEYYDAVKERRDNWGNLVGLSTGNWVLDKMTMGLAPGEMTVIAASTSQGKTLLAMNIAANIVKQNHDVLFVTLEMMHEEAGVRFNIILGDEEYERRLSNIFFQKSDQVDWTSIEGMIKRAVLEANCKLIVIDHLHYFSRDTQPGVDEIGKITKEFKRTAIKYRVPIILISHTRKAPDSHSRGTGINDLKGSSAIAQDADIVLMVRRDMKEYPDDIIITLEKNRNRHGVNVGSEYHFKLSNLKIHEPAYNPKFLEG